MAVKPSRIVIDTPIAENASARFTGVLKDEGGSTIPAASLTTLTLTIYDQATGAVINSRNDVSILNANGGVVDGSGNLVMQFDPADNAIQDATKILEPHIWLFEWSWLSGARAGRQEVLVKVLNMVKVP